MFLTQIRSTVLSLFCVALAACATKETQNGDSVFFDTQHFITQQIELLEELNPSVNRTNVLNGQTEQIVFSEVDWKSELELFLDSDINKSSYLPSYTIEKSTPLTTIYSLKEGENLPVKFMQVTLDSTTQQPEMIVATLFRDNKLFTSEKNIQLLVGDHQGKRMISEYQVKGYKEVLLLGKTTFSLTGVVNY